MIFKNISLWFFSKLNFLDFVILSIFSLVVIWNPYYLQREMNLFELGLYLPGIGAILDGQIPFRDFFHLRGPFELYVPAMMMKFFGENVAVLSTYFYLGNALCLIVCILIAFRVFPNRWIYYSFVPVLIARTYPRVVYTYWGGFRYVWGLLVIYCLVEFLLSKKKFWVFLAGLLTALAALTSLEIGVSAAIATVTVLLFNEKRFSNLGGYVFGLSIFVIPYFFYLLSHTALSDYFHAQWLVATQMTKTFPQTEPVPSNFIEVLGGLLNPISKNFRQMTPVYTYIFFAVYYWLQNNKKQINAIDQAVMGIAVYGILVYVTGFRNIWASVFEMSLQPEKLVLFYLIFKVISASKLNLNKNMSKVLITAVILSSLGYSFDRFNKRFLFFCKLPFQNESSEFVNLPRMEYVKVPSIQAQDFNQLNTFIHEHTHSNEKIWMYPELGAFHFMFDRPSVGKFPTATLAWMDEKEYADYMNELNQHPPQFAIVNKKVPEYFDKSYFPVKSNVRKYNEQMEYLNHNYSIISSTPTYHIYQYKN